MNPPCYLEASQKYLRCYWFDYVANITNIIVGVWIDEGFDLHFNCFLVFTKGELVQLLYKADVICYIPKGIYPCFVPS